MLTIRLRHLPVRMAFHWYGRAGLQPASRRQTRASVRGSIAMQVSVSAGFSLASRSEDSSMIPSYAAAPGGIGLIAGGESNTVIAETHEKEKPVSVHKLLGD